jgi:hypothetical protein
MHAADQDGDITTPCMQLSMKANPALAKWERAAREYK